MKRKDVKSEYKIDLKQIYKSSKCFENDCKYVLEKLEELETYKGNVVSSPENLYQVLELSFNTAYKTVDKINTYALLMSQIDASDIEGKNVVAKSKNINTEFSKRTAFIDDEILKCDFKLIEQYIHQNDNLKLYEFYLKQLFKDKKHILSEKEEKLLSEMANIASDIETNREILFYEDLKYGKVRDENGKQIEITNQNYAKLLESGDRNFRRRVFKTYNKSFHDFQNTFASLLNSKLNYDINKARIRGYKSPLDMSLSGYNLEESVIDNLLSIANENKELYKKYNDLTKKVLGYKTLYSYDFRYNPIPKSDKKYSINDANDMILKALNVYGTQYRKYLMEMFEGKRIDYLPTDNKGVGVFCISSYDIGSYAFLNYQQNLEEIFSLAHEVGHAVHSMYTINNNEPVYSSYSGAAFLLVEIPSLTNEILLAEYILKTSNDIYEHHEVLKRLLEVLLVNFFLVLGRLEVQNKMYEHITNGNALTSDYINEVSGKTSTKYELNGVKLLEENKYNWMRVSHFYNLYYNYQYAIGVSIATLFAEKILTEDKKEIEKYFEFLKSTARDYPTETLKEYGVDLNSKEVFKPLINYINNKLNDFEEIINQMEMN